MKTVVSTPHAPAAIGAYNQAIVAAGLVHCSGQIALDPATGEFVSDDVAEQAAQCLKNLAAVLAAAGSSLERAVKCTVFLADMDDFAAVNEVYARAFEGTDAPARAAVAVRTLPKNARVEIDCVALA